MKINYQILEKKIDVKFKNINLLIKSLTHKSFDSEDNNEKIEFLGDRVLGLVLAKKLLEAGNISGEKLWRLPLGKEYDDEINSIRADMKNIGSTRFGGSIHAAQFIQRFIHDNIPWAHLDIAGVSWIMKSNNNTFSKLHSPGATAFGVNLIDKFLRGK